MLGSFDNDISNQLADGFGQELREDLEILEEYLAGVLLSPLSVEPEEPQSDDLSTFAFGGNEDEDEIPTVVSPAVVEETAAPTFTTSTMAEIYVSQGFIQRAIDIYEEMLRENPTNDGIVQRIGELFDMLTPPVEDEPQVETLEQVVVVPDSVLSVPAVEVAPEPVLSAPTGEHEVVSTLEQWLSNIKSSRRR